MRRASRRNGHTLLIVAVILSGLLGVLLAITWLKPDPQAIQARLIEDLKSLEARARSDPEILDPGFEALLAVPEYREHGAGVRRAIEKAHPGVHARALAEREARREAGPFLALTKDAAAIPEADLGRLLDEGRALRDRHAETRTAEALDSRFRMLEERLAKRTRKAADPLDLIRLQVDVQKDLREGRFAPARGKAADFSRAHDADADVQARLRPLQESIEKGAATHAESVLSRAREHAAAGRKSEALQLLEQALPNLAGFPQVGPLEALARGLR